MPSSPPDPAEILRVAMQVHAQGGASQQRSYEDRAARHALKLCGVDPAGVAARARREGGSPDLGFAHVDEAIPGMGIRLAVSRLPFLHELTFDFVINKFHKTAFFSAYVDRLDDLGGGPPLALVFAWPRVAKGQFMVISPVPPAPADPPDFQIVAAARIHRVVETLVVERLANLLSRLGHGTIPEKDVDDG